MIDKLTIIDGNSALIEIQKLLPLSYIISCWNKIRICHCFNEKIFLFKG